jgi:hypothetical protein
LLSSDLLLKLITEIKGSTSAFYDRRPYPVTTAKSDLSDDSCEVIDLTKPGWTDAKNNKEFDHSFGEKIKHSENPVAATFQKIDLTKELTEGK